MTRREALKALEEAVEDLEFMYVNHHVAVTDIQHEQDRQTIAEANEALEVLKGVI